MNIKDFFETCIYNNYILCNKKFNDSDLAYKQTKFALKELLQHYNFNGFTRTSNVRNSLQTYLNKTEDILSICIDIILNTEPQTEQGLILYNALLVTKMNHSQAQAVGALKHAISGNPNSYKAFSRYSANNTKINYREELKKNLSSDQILDIMLDTVVRTSIKEKQHEVDSIDNYINEKHKKQISNFKVNPYALNICKSDILQGKQQSFKHVDYSIQNLYASMDIGNVRTNQEDSVIIITHPNNPDFKMLVVADGAGRISIWRKSKLFHNIPYNGMV